MGLWVYGFMSFLRRQESRVINNIFKSGCKANNSKFIKIVAYVKKL